MWLLLRRPTGLLTTVPASGLPILVRTLLGTTREVAEDGSACSERAPLCWRALGGPTRRLGYPSKTEEAPSSQVAGQQPPCRKVEWAIISDLGMERETSLTELRWARGRQQYACPIKLQLSEHVASQRWSLEHLAPQRLYTYTAVAVSDARTRLTIISI